MKIEPYLNRIHYQGGLEPNLENLRNLQVAHLLHVPFENLDIHRKVEIDLEGSYDKIVMRNRGGFCYELNGLFYDLLKALGYSVRLISGRVYEPEKAYGPEFDHMAVLARVEEQEYLVDVGFGEFAFHPLPLELNRELEDPRGIFLFEPQDDREVIVRKKMVEAEYKPEYLFTMEARLKTDFLEMCRYHQSSPHSHFTLKRICSLAKADGRISLTGRTLKRTTGQRIESIELANEEEVAEVLRRHFQIEL